MLRLDRALLVLAMTIITVLAWVGMYHMAALPHAHGVAGPGHARESWRLAYLAPMFLMWNIMAVAMMVPTAAPMILTFSAGVEKQQYATAGSLAPTIAFLAGYLLLWVAYSVIATVSQWGLDRAALLSLMTMRSTPPVNGVLLIGAGIYQWMPLKHRCLHHCRMPAGAMAAEWQNRKGRGFPMGLLHGIYDVGCCWALMALMFVGGLMNLFWMALLTLIIGAEKLIPGGHAFGRVVGVVCVVAGIWVIVRAV